MILIFLDRSRRADRYPWLLWKVRLFVIGAGLAVGGMLLELPWLVYVAIAVLVAGFAIRFLPGGRGVEEEGGEPADDRSGGVAGRDGTGGPPP